MNVIITGASSGIGYHTAWATAMDPMVNKILVIARNKQKLKKLMDEFKGKIHPFIFDLEHGSMTEFKEKVENFFETDKGATIEVLINNAGHLINKAFLEITDEEWLQIFQINFFSNVRLIRTLYPYFNKNEGSHIINIASMGGIQGSVKFAGLSAYSATKAALNNLTESLAVEFAGDHIHVNSINPGAVQTPMLKKAFPEFTAKVSPKQMGDFISGFALNSGKVMNGRIIPVSLES